MHAHTRDSIHLRGVGAQVLELGSVVRDSLLALTQLPGERGSDIQKTGMVESK